MDGVVETSRKQSLSFVVVVEPMSELVTISALHLDLQVIVAAGIVTVLSNFNVVGELSVDVINAGNLCELFEFDNIQIAWWVPKSLVS